MLDKAFFFRASSSALFRASSSSLRALSSCQDQEWVRSGQMETSWTVLHAAHSSCSCVLVLPKTTPSPPALEGHSRPCGLGAPSPSHCESAAALPSLLDAAPAGGEDVGLDSPICNLPVPRDTSLTPKALRAPRAHLLLPHLPGEHMNQSLQRKVCVHQSARLVASQHNGTKPGSNLSL